MADRPMTDLKQPLVFGLVAASTLVLLILIGVAGENVDWGPNLDPSPREGEPYSRKTQTEYVEFIYAFLFRFAFVVTIFLLAVLIAYLAR